MDKDISSDGTSVIKLTRKQVVFILLLFAVLLIAVGLLAGLIKPESFSLPVRKSPAFSSPSVTKESGDVEPWLSSRLPRHIVPLLYDLTLFPDFYRPRQNDARFYGNVSILINVTLKPTRYLVVHANRLTIHKTTVRLRRSMESVVSSVRMERISFMNVCLI